MLSEKENLAKLFKDKTMIIAGKKTFNCFMFSRLEKLLRKTNINNVEIQKINWGLVALIKKTVIGQINIKIKKIFFFWRKLALMLKVKPFESLN